MCWLVISSLFWLIFVTIIIVFTDNQEYKNICKFIIIIVLLHDIFVTFAYFNL